MKKKSPPKKLPEFADEQEEQEFWKTHDVREYINWNNAKPFVERFFRNKKDSAALLKDLKKLRK
jgi:hypothetical protein